MFEEQHSENRLMIARQLRKNRVGAIARDTPSPRVQYDEFVFVSRERRGH